MADSDDDQRVSNRFCVLSQASLFSRRHCAAAQETSQVSLHHPWREGDARHQSAQPTARER